MTDRLAYGGLVARTVLITLTSLVIGFLVFKTELYPLAGLVTAILVIQVIFLARSLNKTRRKITYFFDAVQSDDSSLHFPDNIKNETEKALNKSLNRVNKLIQDTKKELIMQEQYYSYLIEEATTGLVTFNEKGQVLLCNSAAKLLLGLNRLTHIYQLNNINEKMYLAIKNMKPGDSQVIKFDNEKETVHLAVKSSRITIKEEPLILVTINNIRHELEDQEIESWIRLIRVLTHEIMNSVAPITSMAQTLSTTYSDEKVMKGNSLDTDLVRNTINSLNIIHQRGNGLMSFVDSYRKLTKIPIPKKELFNAKDFLESIRMLISQEKYADQVKFELEVADVELSICADQQQLTHVMINLIRNALDALEGKKDGVIKLCSEKKHDEIILSISDNGTGINQETLDQIFVPFFTTKEKGSGIGLSLSHHIIRMHGGKMEVQSKEKVGTKFSIILSNTAQCST